MSRPRRPLAERQSAVNILLPQSLVGDRDESKKVVSDAAQSDSSIHYREKDHCEDAPNKENTAQQPLATISAANRFSQASEYGQVLYYSSPTIQNYQIPCPHSAQLSSPATAQPTTSLSPRSPLFSPLLSEQDEPPYLSDSNDDLWKEVTAFQRPATELYEQTQSSMKSISQPLMVMAKNAPMFKWRVQEGRITELDYKLHWLNSLQPKDLTEHRRICDLAVSGFEHLRVPPVLSGTQVEFLKLANLTDLRWRLSMFQYLFPLGSKALSLFAQLGDDDLHLLHLPGELPAEEPPDLMYSMTPEIFPSQYREQLKLQVLNNCNYAAPYLSVFLAKRRHGDSYDRIKLWGTHILQARVSEWSRAHYPDKKPTKKPTTKPNANPPAPSIVSISSTVQPELDKRVEGAPHHYCIALEHARYSIWRFEVDLRLTSTDIERQGIKCTQFKTGSPLLSDKQWELLARDLVGIHLDSADQAGALVTGAVKLMTVPEFETEPLSEFVAEESWGDEGWGDAPKVAWKSAFNED